MTTNNEKNQKVIDFSGEIILSIDYSKTVEQASDYDWKDCNITFENFPISPEMAGKKMEVKTKLFHFRDKISSVDAIAAMDKAGYRPAILMELLFLGVAYPKVQRQFLIVALGSLWRPSPSYHYSVPYLYGSGDRDKLDLGWYGNSWDGNCRFLGIRK